MSSSDDPHATTVFALLGERVDLPCGVFSTIDEAERAISQDLLSGLLTSYPIDVLIPSYRTEESEESPRMDWRIEADMATSALSRQGVCGFWTYKDGVRCP
jgi:hypothetical protein